MLFDSRKIKRRRKEKKKSQLTISKYLQIGISAVTLRQRGLSGPMSSYLTDKVFAVSQPFKLMPSISSLRLSMVIY